MTHREPQSRRLWKDKGWFVIDVETTGLAPPPVSRVVEFGYCVVEAGGVSAAGAVLVKPEKLTVMPPAVIKVHGITLEMLADAEPFAAYAAQVANSMRDANVTIAYNVPFDRPHIEYEMRVAALKAPVVTWLDPCVWVKHLDRGAKGPKPHSLTATCLRRHIEVPSFESQGDAERPHRAGYDALAAALLVLQLAKELPDDLDELLVLQERWRRQQDAEREAWG